MKRYETILTEMRGDHLLKGNRPEVGNAKNTRWGLDQLDPWTGLLDLVGNSPIQAGGLRKISGSVSDDASRVPRDRQPDTGLAAKFSVQFAMASGIIAKRVGPRELTAV